MARTAVAAPAQAARLLDPFCGCGTTAEHISRERRIDGASDEILPNGDAMIRGTSRRYQPPRPPAQLSRERQLEVDNIALKRRVQYLETELARFRGTDTMMELEAYATLSRIIRATAAVGDVGVGDLKGPDKHHRLARLRHAAMYVAYVDTGRLSYPGIGRYFGDRDHSSVHHGVQRIERELKDPKSDIGFLLDDIRRGAGVAARES